LNCKCNPNCQSNPEFAIHSREKRATLRFCRSLLETSDVFQIPFWAPKGWSRYPGLMWFCPPAPLPGHT
jgi:hypothetical protein